MVLGGLALAFSRLIDNSVIVLENIFRHLELGEAPEAAAERGGREVGLAVLAATLTTSVVFFPVVFLYGVSRFLFVALALAVVLSLFASYFVAMTVVPLFCAKLIKQRQADEELGDRFLSGSVLLHLLRICRDHFIQNFFDRRRIAGLRRTAFFFVNSNKILTTLE